MKNASTALKNYLASARQLMWVDLWTIALASGTTLYYSDGDIPVTYDTNLFTDSDVIWQGATIDQSYGLDATTSEVMAYPKSTSTANGVPFLQACASGMLNRANVTKQRLFMETWGSTSLGAALLFSGQITNLGVTRNSVKFTCKDARNLLNIYMPQRLYQPGCQFVFGDNRCGFNRSSLTVSASATAGSSLSVLLATALTQTSGYFNNGVVKFTSGKNNGLSCSVKSYSPGYVQLVAPFPVQPQPGDTFNITPGCNKTFAGVTTQENATAFYGSTPELVLNNIGAAAGTYNDDYILWTSGGNNGTQAMIQSWSPGAATMAAPFLNEPQPTDNFNIVDANGNVLTSGSVTNPLSSSVIPTQLTDANGVYNGGTLEFTSGANVGQTQTISTWENGIAYMSSAFGSTPAIGDECVLTTAPATSQGSCTGYWGSNAALHFGGMPFIPVPETAY